MRWTSYVVLTTAAVLAGVAGVALAQDAPKYDELKKQYDNAVASLKVAQDAKNDLANKNLELTKQIETLQKQLGDVMRERDDLARQAATHAERTYQLRSSLAAWQEFMKRYPTLHNRWKIFLEAELLEPANEPPALPEPAWPFRLEG